MLPQPNNNVNVNVASRNGGCPGFFASELAPTGAVVVFWICNTRVLLVNAFPSDPLCIHPETSTRAAFF
jgi:hypothetical protein